MNENQIKDDEIKKLKSQILKTNNNYLSLKSNFEKIELNNENIIKENLINESNERITLLKKDKIELISKIRELMNIVKSLEEKKELIPLYNFNEEINNIKEEKIKDEEKNFDNNIKNKVNINKEIIKENKYNENIKQQKIKYLSYIKKNKNLKIDTSNQCDTNIKRIHSHPNNSHINKSSSIDYIKSNKENEESIISIENEINQEYLKKIHTKEGDNDHNSVLNEVNKLKNYKFGFIGNILAPIFLTDYDINKIEKE